MYSVIETQKIKLFEQDTKAKNYRVLLHADSRDFVEIDGKLTYIMPEDIDVIGESAFFDSSIQQIKFSSNLKKIMDDAFSSSLLEEAIIPNTVKEIGKGAFIYCRKLSNIVLPNELNMVKARTFCDCAELKTITFPESVFYIGERCFETSGLKDVVIPKSINVVDDGAFTGLKLDSLVVESSNINIAKEAFYQTEAKSVKVDGKDYCFGNLDRYEKHICRSINNKEMLDKLRLLSDNLGKQHIQYAFALELIKNNKQNGFVDSYFKYYNQAYKLYFGDTNNPLPGLVAAFQKLCFNLGIFDKNVAQKPAEFIKQMYEERKLSPRDMTTLFNSMKLNGYNKGFTEFFCDRKVFEELMHKAQVRREFISRIYNAFDEVQKYNVSKNTQHRQLAPTIEKFEQYFSTSFKGSENYPEIAKEIAKFSDKQEDFDYAVKVFEKYLAMVESTGYVDKAIKEEDVFERIDYYAKQIETNMIDTAAMLGELASKDYTCEWLAKNDPRNYTLGYYCSCCAHVSGVGEGIVEASIILPNMRNLVVKDKRGDIKAKSTLFINEEKGYAVCNNVEINIDQLGDNEKLKKIYNKYLKAVNDFVDQYNASHAIPITQVAVGMGKNDLEPLLKTAKRPSEILKAINFKQFGRKDYEGDWQKQQRLIYSSEEGDLWKK